MLHLWGCNKPRVFIKGVRSTAVVHPVLPLCCCTLQVMRQAVSETVDVLKMKPLIMKLMEE